MFSRALSTSCRASKATPLARTRDALLSSPSAQHFVLAQSGAAFIVRSPPSPLPPSLPHPITAASPVASTSATPFSSVQPFLTSSETEHLLPPSHPHVKSTTTLDAPAIAELQALRRDNPSYWTRTRLAQKFLVGPAVVARLGWGPGALGREAERSRRREVDAERERREGSWGWKKTIAREERQRRRAMW